VDVGRTQRLTRTVLLIITAAILALAGCSALHTPGSTPQPIATSTVTVSAPQASASPSEAPPATTTVGVVPSVDDEVLVDVDPDKYRSAPPVDGYFFVSPGMNLACGFVPFLDGQLTGCQALVKVANLPECDAPQSNSSPAIDFQTGKMAAGHCLSQGVFNSGSRVLQYGGQITVGGVTCTSRRTGVTCIDRPSGRGFKASREAFLPIG